MLKEFKIASGRTKQVSFYICQRPQMAKASVTHTHLSPEAVCSIVTNEAFRRKERASLEFLSHPPLLLCPTAFSPRPPAPTILVVVMPVSHYGKFLEDPLGIPLELEYNTGVTLDQIPCGSLADPLRIPLELEHATLGGSAGDPHQGIHGGFGLVL